MERTSQRKNIILQVCKPTFAVRYLHQYLSNLSPDCMLLGFTDDELGTLRREFNRSTHMVREQYNRKIDAMQSTISAGGVELARLREELNTAHEENRIWMDTNLQLNADVVQYRSSWLAADHQVKRLTAQLEPIRDSTLLPLPSTQPPNTSLPSKRAMSSPIESASGMDLNDGNSSEVEIVHVRKNVRVCRR
jgi:hypothetical protein